MKFLITGLGSIGRRHLRMLEALGEKDVILYRTQRGTLPDEGLASYPVETDLKTALAHKPDAAIISNPTSLHLEVAIPAAQTGCHLLLEKPISHNLERVSELQSAVAGNHVQVLVGFQFRHHPGLKKIAELLEQGAIGRPLSARAHWGEYMPDWHPWEDYRKGYAGRKDLGGGAILTLTHPLDYLRWFLGEVVSLSAFAGKLSDLEIDVEDTAEISLCFGSGALASVHLDYVQRPRSHTLEIIGNEGTIRWDNADGAVELYEAKAGAWQRYPAPHGFARDDLFKAQMAHFIEVIQGKAQPVCTLQDGIRALELALAAHQSSATGKFVSFASPK